MNWQTLYQELKSRCGRTYVSAKTGKKTKRCGYIRAHGEETFITMPLNEQKGVDYALEDIEAMTILCAWCSKPIFIGEAVTLYSPSEEDFVIPKHAVVYHRDPLILVGCLRWNCALTGAARSGFWHPDNESIGKGYVYRVPNALELCIANPNAECIIMNNVGDPMCQPIIFPKKEKD